MSRQMKLIMENWNRHLNEQEPAIETVGQLRKVIANYRAGQTGTAIGKKAMEMSLEQVPGLSNIYSIWKGAKQAKDLISKLYGSEDSFVSNTGLDKLNVDDDVSNIVDDRIETAFMNHLLDMLSDADPNEPIPDSDIEIQKFLASKFNQKQVKK